MYHWVTHGTILQLVAVILTKFELVVVLSPNPPSLDIIGIVTAFQSATSFADKTCTESLRESHSTENAST